MAHFLRKQNKDCHCPQELVCLCVACQCIPLTTEDILDTRGDKLAVSAICQCYRVPNTFYLLLFADRAMGVAGACTWKIMQAINLGLFEYQIESFCDILGEKRPELLKNCSTNISLQSLPT